MTDQPQTTTAEVVQAHATRPSTYVAFGIWACSALSAQPTLTSLILHVAVMPLLLVLILWLRGYEERRT
jgi:hypothetical protein